MKLKKLEELLQQLEVFKNPKVKLEQYATSAHLAARMLHTVQANFGEIEGKMIADLGCGCGILTAGSCLLGAQVCIGMDIDPDALKICQSNCELLDVTQSDIVACDITKHIPQRFHSMFDCVVMNPPFGTKVKGLDVEFLKAALLLTNHSVYSLHKKATRDFLVKKAESLGAKAEVLAELRFDLPHTYKFHKKNSVDIEVDFVRLTIE